MYYSVEYTIDISILQVVHMSIFIDQLACNGCYVCVDLCPTNALKIISGTAQVIDMLCIDCEACVIRCPARAIFKD